MTVRSSATRYLLLAGWLVWLSLAPAPASADEMDSSGFGAVAIPRPAKPVDASSCVEPVDVMRREHMNFLQQQQDATVIDGERGGKYSLVGCIECHNPADSAATAVRYPEPQHFCAGCHLYASVRIDCFECHADRGFGQAQQDKLDSLKDSGLSTLHTFQQQAGLSRAD